MRWALVNLISDSHLNLHHWETRLTKLVMLQRSKMLLKRRWFIKAQILWERDTYRSDQPNSLMIQNKWITHLIPSKKRPNCLTWSAFWVVKRFLLNFLSQEKKIIFLWKSLERVLVDLSAKSRFRLSDKTCLTTRHLFLFFTNCLKKVLTFQKF